MWVESWYSVGGAHGGWGLGGAVWVGLVVGRAWGASVGGVSSAAAPPLIRGFLPFQQCQWCVPLGFSALLRWPLKDRLPRGRSAQGVGLSWTQTRLRFAEHRPCRPDPSWVQAS